MIWSVLEHGSSSVKLSVYQDLLDKAARLLPTGKSGVSSQPRLWRSSIDELSAQHIKVGIPDSPEAQMSVLWPSVWLANEVVMIN
ncbi:MAG: hypothetical protein B0A82_05610 [Alkalinema sp. CACIAM 70d]|nr:MAG: hypothetical protein B0A82_05610 [Alkalinema sp. CACIAM 70d]